MVIGKFLRIGRAAVAAVALLGAMPAWSGDIFYKVYSDGYTVPMSLETARKAPALPISKSFTANGITFNVTYGDDGTGAGFDDPVSGGERKARAEGALATLASALNETGTLDVFIDESTDLPGNALALGGTFFPNEAGFNNGAAFDRIQTGVKPFGSGVPEFFVQVDFDDSNFYSGANPLAIGPGQSDLESVMLHEFTHGLGFVSLSNANGENVFSPPAHGVYTFYDSLMRLGSGEGALALFDEPQPVPGATFQGTPAALVSGNLFFAGAAATGSFGGNPPIYAPATFALGSSLSHWDTNNVPSTAVMEHLIFSGEVNRDYPDFERAALFDLGWSNVQVDNTPPPTPDNSPFPPPPPGAVPVGGPLATVLLAAILLALGLALAPADAYPRR